jgi:hypothetical protein
VVELTNASFSTAFSFIMDAKCSNFVDIDGAGGDGIVFVINTLSSTFASAGGLAYLGLDRSIGIEYDTWYNAGISSYLSNKLI